MRDILSRISNLGNKLSWEKKKVLRQLKKDCKEEIDLFNISHNLLLLKIFHSLSIDAVEPRHL